MLGRSPQHDAIRREISDISLVREQPQSRATPVAAGASGGDGQKPQKRPKVSTEKRSDCNPYTMTASIIGNQAPFAGAAAAYCI